ncbi:conserved hypothetical protein [Leptospira interrogans serovar Manilae]|uniref:Uncharacterized protein n=1 Tax=Leptospira interrogans serovar Manilae TaxID=214675 RepID=A0AAQ1SME9_LEPIR|nr:conserved hypothetical protein [Leptospira interrogans serovar Manilae]
MESFFEINSKNYRTNALITSIRLKIYDIHYTKTGNGNMKKNVITNRTIEYSNFLKYF